MKESLAAIGNITNDTEPSDHLGGGVAYSAIAAYRQGSEASIITKCRINDPYITELENIGVNVYQIPSKKNVITTFENYYDLNGNRKQKAPILQELIVPAEINDGMINLIRGAVVLVATVAGEVDPQLYPLLSRHAKLLAITPQGYYRMIGKNGEVRQQTWNVNPKHLQCADIAVLSIEDLTRKGKFDRKGLKTLTDNIPIVALTKGENGSVIFENGEKKHTIKSFPLRGKIFDLTGAGDTYAASFIHKYNENGDTHESGIYASLYAAVKIASKTEEGIRSIPTNEQVDIFIRENEERYREFIKINH